MTANFTTKRGLLTLLQTVDPHPNLLQRENNLLLHGEKVFHPSTEREHPPSKEREHPTLLRREKLLSQSV